MNIEISFWSFLIWEIVTKSFICIFYIYTIHKSSKLGTKISSVKAIQQRILSQ